MKAGSSVTGRICSPFRGGSLHAGIVAAALLFLGAAACDGAASSPAVGVTGPAGPVHVGEDFTILVKVSWDGGGSDIEAGRPSFDIPESLKLAASTQESRTVLRDGSPHSTKEYCLVFTAEQAGDVEIGPFSLNAKRGGDEFGLTGKAVEIEVGAARSGMWIPGSIAILVVLGIIFYMLRRKRRHTELLLNVTKEVTT